MSILISVCRKAAAGVKAAGIADSAWQVSSIETDACHARALVVGGLPRGRFRGALWCRCGSIFRRARLLDPERVQAVLTRWLADADVPPALLDLGVDQSVAN